MSAAGPRILPLRDVLTRWDVVVARWALDPEERGALLGGFGAGPVADVDTYRLLCGEQRMRLVVELEPHLHRIHGDAGAARTWLRTANASLGGRTPIAVMSASPEWMRWLIDYVGCRP